MAEQDASERTWHEGETTDNAIQHAAENRERALRQQGTGGDTHITQPQSSIAREVKGRLPHAHKGEVGGEPDTNEQVYQGSKMTELDASGGR